MPLYEFECDVCAHRFEVIQKFSDPHPKACPKCGGAVQKLLSSPAIQFKGSGFYLTDYGRSGSSADSASAKSGKAESGSSGGSDKGSEGSSSAKSESSSSDSGSSPASKPAAAAKTD